MSTYPVARLFPPDGTPCALAGLYLQHDLRGHRVADRPFVYTNFIASLDGRISETQSGRRQVPAAIANPRDWRLYMELLAQCDALLTTARHLRAVAAGRQQEFMDLGRREFQDLCAWRSDRGLSAKPSVVVMSAALDIPPGVHERLGTGLLVVTSQAAPAARLRELTESGIEVLTCSPGARVEIAAMLRALHGRGVASLYSIAGPGVLHGLLAANAVDRLYLTLAQTLLGGERYDTLTRGPALSPPAGLRLHELYLDEHAPAGAGQLLMSFDRRS